MIWMSAVSVERVKVERGESASLPKSTIGAGVGLLISAAATEPSAWLEGQIILLQSLSFSFACSERSCSASSRESVEPDGVENRSHIIYQRQPGQANFILSFPLGGKATNQGGNFSPLTRTRPTPSRPGQTW